MYGVEERVKGLKYMPKPKSVLCFIKSLLFAVLLSIITG
ncbi:hypothetical protein ADICYQ_4422 [Cyclobacterium qasimii M12-11B]|uniref:Uncharacterized protein n=1 Tax=Cyclobacterium qasimii M12-11B TaxID=641524 RepID=S7WR24_9BACT|nr:hypothetical protein ADICYQ_4422 [Cyclobacterium qasimii M12-11B]